VSADAQRASAGGNAYPIAGFTYILVRANTYKDLAKAQALTDFVCWGLTEGQGAARSPRCRC
jgi:ABC-type phosphate transport system substrate-binding protein